MKGIITMTTTNEGNARTAKPDELTLILPLRKKESISLDDFYAYWLNAHVTLPPRFPGIHDIWLHAVTFDDALWPAVSGVSHRPESADEFQGVPEATFPTLDDLAAFQGASGVQMDDGENFLAEQIAYRSLRGNTVTVLERGDPAATGHEQHVRHLLFLRRRPDVRIEDLRSFVIDELAPVCAAGDGVVKVRRHLFEEVELTLDHPNVAMFKPLDRQYQAMVEVVLEDENALSAFASSAGWATTANRLLECCVAAHAARVTRCVTTKYRGQITLAGIRGVAAADAITRLGAHNQTGQEITDLFLPWGFGPAEILNEPLHPQL